MEEYFSIIVRDPYCNSIFGALVSARDSRPYYLQFQMLINAQQIQEMAAPSSQFQHLQYFHLNADRIRAPKVEHQKW